MCKRKHWQGEHWLGAVTKWYSCLILLLEVEEERSRHLVMRLTTQSSLVMSLWRNCQIPLQKIRHWTVCEDFRMTNPDCHDIWDCNSGWPPPSHGWSWWGRRWWRRRWCPTWTWAPSSLPPAPGRGRGSPWTRVASRAGHPTYLWAGLGEAWCCPGWEAVYTLCCGGRDVGRDTVEEGQTQAPVLAEMTGALLTSPPQYQCLLQTCRLNCWSLSHSPSNKMVISIETMLL